MQENIFIKREKELQQIADMLLLNGTLTECSGLVNGKIGIAVFFFHYAKVTGNTLFADYAMDVIGEMLNQIHVNSSADYEKGIGGIGVGIDYLIQNNFLIVEEDICEDFDQRMVRAVMYDPWEDFSQYNGLTGYGRYWITRLHYQEPGMLARKCLFHILVQIDENLSDISIDEQTDVFCFLSDLQKIVGFESCIGLLERCREQWSVQSSSHLQSFSRLGNSDVGNMVRSYQRNKYFTDANLHDNIDFGWHQIRDLDMEKAPTGTGLLNGYAGEGMLRMVALNQTNTSWMDLL